MSYTANAVEREKNRIETEYRRREAEVASDLYAPWQPAESLMVSERKNTAALLLQRAGKFPRAGDRCLEIGYGRLGWLADLISWRLRETDLHGIELDAVRAAEAQAALPNADLRVGDATALPWETGSFKLVVVSTVFSSILNPGVRKLIAAEISRVVAPGGVLVWYDLAVDNPRNSQVKSLGADEIKKLFPEFAGEIKRVTLAPPIARRIAPRSLTLAAVLGALPFLRTHRLAVLVRN